MKSLIHIIEKSRFEVSDSGANKDISGRITWFQSSTFLYHQIFIKSDSPAGDAFACIKDLSAPIFLIEYSFYPRILLWIKKNFPRSVVIIRAHNIEPLQHFANYGWFPKGKSLLWVFYGCIRLLVSDIIAKLFASSIAVINDNEIDTYWRWLPGRASIQWLPYLPPNYLDSPSLDRPGRRNIIACMPRGFARRDVDMVKRFVKFAKSLKAAGVNYEFIVTGSSSYASLDPDQLVKFVGFIDDIQSFRSECLAICFLSQAGYGFKTSIHDALRSGAFVIAHPGLIAKSPDLYKSVMISLVDHPTNLVALFARQHDFSCISQIESISVSYLSSLVNAHVSQAR